MFAKKVIDALEQHEPWSLVASELQGGAPTIGTCPATTDECLVHHEELTAAQKDEILKKTQHIHSVSGHGSLDVLVRSLQQRGVPAHVLEVAKQFTCSICAERKRTDPRRPSTLETVPKEWEVVQVDLGTWTNPHSREKFKFILFVDEGSRFKVGKVLFENSRQQATWDVVQKCFEEHWLSVFGTPAVLRTDPEGTWRSEAADAYCQQRGIELTPIPAEAHWQIGIVESSIRAVKRAMTRLSDEYSNLTPQECLAKALWACNARDNHHGYSMR